MKQTGLQLLARFSLPPNRLGLCGSTDVSSSLSTCIQTGACSAISKVIPGFKTQLPYLQTIAKVTNKQPTDHDVVRAYWLGDDLLRQFTVDHYQLFLDFAAKLSLPDFYLHTLQQFQPRFFIPFHAYSVRVLTQFPVITKQLQIQMDKCMIQTVKITQDMIDTGLCDMTLNPAARVGGMAAVHWETVVYVLSTKETQQLLYWNNQITSLANARE